MRKCENFWLFLSLAVLKGVRCRNDTISPYRWDIRNISYPRLALFTCACGDIAFCPTNYLKKIVERIRSMRDKTFLIQSKNPATFKRVKWPRWWTYRIVVTCYDKRERDVQSIVRSTRV